MAIAVIDIGRTNCKVIVLDDDGRTLDHETTATPDRSGPPYRHLDTAAIWAWLTAALARARTTAPISTIVPVAHGATAALVDDDDPVLPVLDYEDKGPETVTAAYEPLRDPFSRTFSPLLPAGLTLGRQIFWLQHAFPADFARTRSILTYPQYWAWRLTGVSASEVTSLGCHTDLWRPADDTFSGLVARAGWTGLMPPRRSAWEVLGPVRGDLAQAAGLSPDCAVLCGIHDSNASYLVHLADRSPPFTVVSTGTWMIVFAAGGRLDSLDPALDMLANVDATGTPTPTARFMAGREFAAIAGDDGLDAHAGHDDLEAVIRRAVMALPGFVQDGGPFGGRAGTIDGGGGATAAERNALASLYCALVLDVMLDRLGAAGPLLIEGPFASNTVFLAAIDRLRPGQTVHASADISGTAAGAYRLATWRRSGGRPAVARSTALRSQPIAGLDVYRSTWRGRIEILQRS